MSTMIEETLATDGSWTLIASGPIANILIVGLPSGWEVYIADAEPADSEPGVPVTALDGAWGSTALDAGDNVYARPFGQYEAVALTVKGMVN